MNLLRVIPWIPRVTVTVVAIRLFSLNDVAAADAALRLFEQEIRPVLAESCIECHGPKKQKGGLRLDSNESLLRGGDSGVVIDAGRPDASLLLSALRYEDLEMPPKEPLPESRIQAFEKWIAAGAPWPKQHSAIRSNAETFTDSDRDWWAFRAVARPLLPTVQQTSWPDNAIDYFVLAKMEQDQLYPAPEASSHRLVRRLYFDLLGLPPTPADLVAFESDPRPDRWERLVDRLLTDPRHGEHWARDWLDLVRFSDSDGWNQDAYRPTIWRYRDYVIKALNENKPYPEFVAQQLAGDELAPDDPESITATGFLRLGIYEYNQRDARGHWNDIMNEMTDVAGDVFLGMSMACARCHDHKFDPVLQKDYFKLRSFFEPVIWRDDLKAATPADRETFAQQQSEWEAATKPIQEKIEALLSGYYERKWETTVEKFPLDIQDCFHRPVEQRTSLDHQMAYLVSRQFMEEGGGPLKSLSKEDKAQHEALKAELAKFDSLKPEPLPSIMAVTDFDGTLSPTVVPNDPEEEPIQPGFLTVLSPSSGKSIELPSTRQGSGRRSALAAWIGRDDNPLTPRVIVNRVWQHHFGKGLVATPNDFGHNGAKPTHPQLLDWLTSRFIESGWDLKSLHRIILNSATWRQTAAHPDALAHQERDPGEERLWRYPVQRLRAEQIRDAMLVVSGELENRIGGPGISEDQPSRALYVKQFRNRNDTLLHAFDLGGGLKSVAVRNTTTTPTQSLIMINGDYVLARARQFANRVLGNHPKDPRAFARRATQLAWGRGATVEEIQRSVQYLASEPGSQLIERQRAIDFCHVLFNSNEFLYLD